MELKWEYCQFGKWYYCIWIKYKKFYYQFYGQFKLTFWKTKYNKVPTIYNIGIGE